MSIKKSQKATPEISTKQPKTIKVKTLVIAILWLASLLGAAYTGWTLRSVDNARVSQEAQAMVQMLSKESK